MWQLAACTAASVLMRLDSKSRTNKTTAPSLLSRVCSPGPASVGFSLPSVPVEIQGPDDGVVGNSDHLGSTYKGPDTVLLLYKCFLWVNPHTAILEGGNQYSPDSTEDRQRQKAGWPKSAALAGRAWPLTTYIVWSPSQLHFRACTLGQQRRKYNPTRSPYLTGKLNKPSMQTV